MLELIKALIMICTALLYIGNKQDKDMLSKVIMTAHAALILCFLFNFKEDQGIKPLIAEKLCLGSRTALNTSMTIVY